MTPQRHNLIPCLIFLCLGLLLPSYASASTALGNTSTISLPANNIGLVGYWTMDGPTQHWTTGKLDDVSGQGNTGTMVGMSTSTSPVPGKIGGALKFNGSTSYVNVSNTYAYTANAPFSESAWGYVSSYTNTAGGYPILVSAGGGRMELRLEGATGDPAFVDGAAVTWSSPISKNVWHHFVGVFDGANMYLYVDGVLRATGAHTNSSGTFNYQIGSRGSTFDWNGNLDDVRIYNRALSAQEVAQLYAQGAANVAHSNTTTGTGLNSGLVGYWTMDGPTQHWTTGKLDDVSGNGNTGQLIGMSTSTSPTVGKIGGALKFNGSNQDVDMGPASLQLSSRISECAWIKLSAAPPSSGGFAVAGKWAASYPRTYTLAIGGSGVSWSGAAFFLTSSSGGTTVFAHSTTTASSMVGKWEDVCGTYDGANIYIYINGIEEASSPYTGTFGFSEADHFVIGAHSDAEEYFPGSIDDVRIYNRALSAQEVAQLYAQGAANVAHSNTTTGTGLNSGLVGYWTMDGPTQHWTTGKLDDVSGNGNTGQLINMSTSTSPVPGKIGGALNTNPGYISIPNSSSLSPTTAITVSMWGKKSAANTDGQAVSKNDSVSATTPYELQWWTDGTIYANITLSSGFVGNIHCPYVANKWYHVVETYDGATVKEYLNGVLCASGAHTGTINTNAKNLYIGSSGGNDVFNGTIDDVRIYNRALLAQEVQQLYLLGK